MDLRDTATSRCPTWWHITLLQRHTPLSMTDGKVSEAASPEIGQVSGLAGHVASQLPGFVSLLEEPMSGHGCLVGDGAAVDGIVTDPGAVAAVAVAVGRVGLGGEAVVDAPAKAMLSPRLNPNELPTAAATAIGRANFMGTPCRCEVGPWRTDWIAVGTQPCSSAKPLGFRVVLAESLVAGPRDDLWIASRS